MTLKMASFSALLRRTPDGFTLIEVGIVSVLSAMMMSSLLLFISDYLRGQQAQATGEALFALNQAVNSYESKYSVQLANNQLISISGYSNVANIYSPTTTELFELGFLQNQTPQGNYGIRISPTLVGGVPSGLVWLAQPFMNQEGEVDQSLAGDAMLAAGGDAGMSTIQNPSQIVGTDGWTMPNPASANPAGIIAMRNGAGSGAYVRLDGSTPMQGPLNMNGNDISNANAVGASTVNTSTLNVSTINNGTLNNSGNGEFGGNVGVSGSFIAGSVTSPTVDASNSLTVGSGGIQDNGGLNTSGNIYSNSSIQANGTIQSNGYLIAQGYAQLGQGCSPNGEIGTDGSQTLFCQNGVWHTGESQYQLVTATACYVDWVDARCPSGWIAVGGGGTSYGIPGCTGIAGPPDANGQPEAPMMDGNHPDSDLGGWSVSGGHVGPDEGGPGDNLEAFAICMRQ